MNLVWLKCSFEPHCLVQYACNIYRIDAHQNAYIKKEIGLAMLRWIVRIIKFPTLSSIRRKFLIFLWPDSALHLDFEHYLVVLLAIVEWCLSDFSNKSGAFVSNPKVSKDSTTSLTPRSNNICLTSSHYLTSAWLVSKICCVRRCSAKWIKRFKSVSISWN